MVNQSFLIEVTTGVFFAGCVVVENVSRNIDNMENTSMQNQQTVIQVLMFNQPMPSVNKIKSG